MTHLIRCLALVPLALAVGCRHAPPAPAPAAGAVEVLGAVAVGGRVPIPAGGLSLKGAVSAAGGVVTGSDANGALLEMLVRVTKGETDYYFSDGLVGETACGEVVLADGDRVEVQAWTDTDLFRALEPDPKTSKPKSSPPSPLGYRPSPAAVAALYPGAAAKKAPHVLDIDLILGTIPTDFQESTRTVRIAPILSHPKLGDARSASANPLPDDPFVFVVARVVEGRPTRFILSLDAMDQTRIDPVSQTPGLNPVESIYRSALLLDGDVVTITLPEAVPLVATSLIRRRQGR